MLLLTGTKNVTTNTVVSDQQFIPLTTWMPAIGVSTVKALIQLTDPTVGFRAEVALQTATTDFDSPNSPVSIPSTSISTETKVCSGMQTVAPVVDPHFYARFGVLIWSDSGGASDKLERSTVSIAVSLRE